MEWNRFEELTTLDCEAHETADTLYEVMEKAVPADLIMPMELRNKLFYGSAPKHSSVLDPFLLALDLEFTDDAETGERVRVPPKTADPSTLFNLAMNPDDTLAVVFHPDARWAHKNYRYDDALDYVFEQYRNGNDVGEAREFIHPLKFNPFPYSNYIMDPATGAPLEWDIFSRLDETYPNGWAPDVPSELRWWLPKLGILDEAGVNQLRPMLAQWWC